MQLKYTDLGQQYTAFVFELDDVLLPVKDYDLQVYYLFANFLEYLQPQFNASEIIEFIKHRYNLLGNTGLFKALVQTFKIDDNYHQNLTLLFTNAQLPLKLLLYKQALSLLQNIIINQKQVFILTSGTPQVQLNKIKQTEWNGMETFLKVYFENEFKQKTPETALHYLINENNLSTNEVIVIGNSSKKQLIAHNLGIKYLYIAPHI
jgi:FMN phosphatase YigB (HAD superfamily)